MRRRKSRENGGPHKKTGCSDFQMGNRCIPGPCVSFLCFLVGFVKHLRHSGRIRMKLTLSDLIRQELMKPHQTS